MFWEAGRFSGGQADVPGDFANVHSLDAGEMLIPIRAEGQMICKAGPLASK